MVARLRELAERAGVAEAQIRRHYGVAALDDLPYAAASEAIARLQRQLSQQGW